MNISRKEFLARGLTAFGRDLLTAVRGDASSPVSLEEGNGSGPLLVDNRRCLASRGGCFSCLDACPHEAISITAGIGIVVAEERCNSCGACIAICPLEPKPLRLISCDVENP